MREETQLCYTFTCFGVKFGWLRKFSSEVGSMREVLSEPEGAALLPLPLLWMRMGIRNCERKSLGCERVGGSGVWKGRGGLVCE